MTRMSPLVIILVTPDGPGSGGGTQQVLRRMIPRWIEAGRNVTLLTHPVDERWEGLPPTVEVIPLPRPSAEAMSSALALLAGIRSIVATARSIRRAARLRPDAVILPFLPGSAILTLVASVGLPNRVIPCERNDPLRQRFSATVRTLRRILYRRADAITVNTAVAVPTLLDIVADRVPVHLVDNPLPDWPEPPPLHDRDRLVVSVGRLVPQKRHADVIASFVEATADRSDDGWELLIVGDGPERDRLARMIAAVAPDGRVHLTGHVSDVRPLLERARVLVLASDFEGTSNALLEGVLCGVAAIVSDAVPDIPSPLVPARPILRFAVGDRSSLTSLLHDVMVEPPDPEPSTPLGLGGRERYALQVDASWTRVFDRLDDAVPPVVE